MSKNMYGVTKLLGEKDCERFSKDFKVITLRLCGIFGKRRKSGAIYNFIKNAKENKEITINSDGNDMWDTIHVDDAVEAILLSLDYKQKNNYEVFNISSGKPIKLIDVAKKIISLIHSNSEIVIENKKPSFNFYLDISKAKKELYYNPSPIENGIEKMIK